MKRFLIASVLAVSLVSACESPPGKLGIVVPPDRYVSSDPSTVDGGLAAPVGFQVFSALGDKSWSKYGTGNSQWQAAPSVDVMSTYSTALIDVTTTGDNIAFVNLPARSGYLFMSRLYTVTVHDGTGTATGNMVWSAGNDGSHQNVLGPVTTSSTTINNLIAVAPNISIGNGGGTGAFADAATQIVLKITTAPTGVTSLHCYFTVSGFWVLK